MRGIRPNLLVGESAAMLDLKAEIERVARSDAKVLISRGKRIEKSSSHRPFTAEAPVPSAPSLPSTAPDCPKRCSNRNCSGTCVAASRARIATSSEARARRSRNNVPG